jgi:glutathione S-transferase
MSAIKLHILKPSVNNMAVRVFVRAAGLEFTEQDAWGHTRSPEFSARNPSHLTPMIEEAGLPKGVLWESCAIMQYLCNSRGLDRFYPKDAGKRAMVDSAMFYMTGTLYPYVARAAYPRLGFPLYAGEVGASEADAAMKAAAQQACIAAVAAPLEVFRQFYMGEAAFIGGASPSIADIRLASTLEFLNAVDYPMPDWATKFLGAIEAALGTAYSEPAGDVRGYITYVKSQAS